MNIHITKKRFLIIYFLTREMRLLLVFFGEIISQKGRRIVLVPDKYNAEFVKICNFLFYFLSTWQILNTKWWLGII